MVDRRNPSVYANTPAALRLRTYLRSQLGNSTQPKLDQHPKIFKGLHRPRVPCRLGSNKNPINDIGDSNEYSGRARGDGCSDESEANGIGPPNCVKRQAKCARLWDVHTKEVV
jgi:hypothetical protein